MDGGSVLPTASAVKLGFTILIATGVITMFEIIPEIDKTAAIAFGAATLWMSCIQYSRFSEHRKKHDGEQDAFAFFPYYIIPLIGVALATVLGIAAVAYCMEAGWIVNSYYALGWSIIASVALFMLLDLVLIHKLGDVAYYETIESKVAEKVAERITFADLSKEDQQKVKNDLMIELLK